MKKLISIILCLVLTVTLFAASASAVSVNAGKDALNNQFKDGKCEGELDYVYYEPDGADLGAQKYPLFIWLHGMKSGVTPRAQLEWYGFCNWSSEEYQARFSNGGCYLLAPRASTSVINSWDATMCSSLKKTIDSFIKQHSDTIDMSRIYISGYSTGGGMVWDMLSAYPSFFAAALPLASIYQPAAVSLNKLTDTSVWIFSSDIDPYPLGQTGAAMGTLTYLAGISNRKDSLRITTFSQAVLADGSKKSEIAGGLVVPASDAEHYIWESVTHDLYMRDGVTPYLYATTSDAQGNKLSFTPGHAVITWLNEQTNEKATDENNLSFIQRIMLYFTRFFAAITAFFSGIFS